MSTDLELVAVTAWQAGYAYAVDLMADVLDDVRYSVFPLPKYTREQRIQQRISLFERCADAVQRQIAAGDRGPWRCT